MTAPKVLIQGVESEWRPPRLEGVDPRAKEWQAVQGWIAKRLAELNHSCTRVGIPERDADAIRGGIRELEALRDLTEPRERIPSDIY